MARMLAKKPTDRYQTPGAVITDLAPWLGQDERARVVAGLSGTDLAGSGALQSTLREMGSGKTEQLESPQTPTVNLLVHKKPLFIGVTAALLVFAVGLYLGMGSGGQKATDDRLAEGTRPQATRHSPSARARTLPEPVVSAPVSPPAVGPSPKPSGPQAWPLLRLEADADSGVPGFRPCAATT